MKSLILNKDWFVGKDEKNWLEIRNNAYAGLTGNDTLLSLKELTKFINGSDFIEGGMKISI